MNEAALERLINELKGAFGPEHGITIDELTQRLGLENRRETEQLIQHNLDVLPFVVVADAHGYYRPTAAEHLNAYMGSLRRRHLPLTRREELIQRKAIEEGWILEGGHFRQSATQMQLL